MQLALVLCMLSLYESLIIATGPTLAKMRSGGVLVKVSALLGLKSSLITAKETTSAKYLI